MRPALVLAAALALPVALLLVHRHRELRRPVPDASTAWFATLRRLSGLGLLGLVLWLCAFSSLDPWRALETAVAPAPRHVARALFFLGLLAPPWLLSHLLGLLARPLFDRMGRGEVAREQQAHALWMSVASVGPLSAFLFGVLALPESPRAGALWLLAVPAVYALAAGRLLGRTDTAPEAVTSGELRDRVFGLAAEVGVQVRQLYVIPGRKAQLANAFAVGRDHVILTDFLLGTLGRRELDAVLAHELSHLKRKHPETLGAAPLVPIVVLAFAVPFAAAWWGLAVDFLQLLPVAAAVWMLTFLALSRRFERIADADAVAQTGDPEGLIRGLARLTRANLLPRTWGRLSWLFTHPSLEERARLVARRGGLDEERALALLREDTAAGDHYAVPETGSTDRVFTTSFKSILALRVMLTTLGLVAALPGAWALAVDAAGVSRPLAVGTLLLGLPGCAAILHLATQRLAVSGYHRLAPRLAARLRDQGFDAGGLIFAGLSPSAEVRVYESVSDWDVGFVGWSGDRLVWLGDHQRFSVGRSGVESVDMVDGVPSWRGEQRVRLSWRGDGEAVWLSLKAADVRSIAESRRATRALCARLEDWRRGADAPAATPALDLPPPRFGAVTSEPLSRHVGPGPAFASAVVAAVAGGLVSLALGLPLDGLGAYPPLAAPALAVWMAVPGLRHREPAEEAPPPEPESDSPAG